MKAQQFSAKAGVLTESVSFTIEAICEGASGHKRKVARIEVEPTMCMKRQQLSAHTGILTELQAKQNKHLTMRLGGQSATQKKILKMKDDPTMCMKTQDHVTECHSQFCDFERGFGTACRVCPPSHRLPCPVCTPRCFWHFPLTFAQHPSAAEPKAFHFISHPLVDTSA